jgi:hypothetical protein
MRRSTAFSTLSQSLRAAFAAAVAVAAMVSCDSYTTSTMETPDGVHRIRVQSIGNVYTAAQKDSMLTISGTADVSLSRVVPIGPLNNVAGSMSVPACGGGTGEFLGYTKSQVPFEPEPIPNIVPYPLQDDGIISDSQVPLGFNFDFEGQTYDKVNVYSNGILLFGPLPGTDGFFRADVIPKTTVPNNIIAVAWSDWSPQLVANGIRWETRGTAPNRKFILQYDNVPEFSSANRPGAISPTVGRLTAQVVLAEGSNDITIYTNDMFTTNSGHTVTQGIENATGTAANYDSVFNSVMNVQQARVKTNFRLQNDAVRFSLISSADEQNPTITPPADETVANDPGLASAFVAVGTPSTNDNCEVVTVSSARSDGKDVDAPYPVGTTTITWTATDGAGNTASATQTITVLDKENPVWDPNFDGVYTRNATSPAGAVVDFDNLPVRDNVGVTSISCEPASGSTFAIGRSPASCTASDAAGNTASKPIVVVVVNAHQQIGNLIEWVRALNLPDGTAQPIINQLLSAYDETADGSASCKKMYDFMTMAQKKDANILGPDVQYMLDQGSRILAVMGCPPSRNSQPVTPKPRGSH